MESAILLQRSGQILQVLGVFFVGVEAGRHEQHFTSEKNVSGGVVAQILTRGFSLARFAVTAVKRLLSALLCDPHKVKLMKNG
jgi:hypothetical protein